MSEKQDNTIGKKIKSYREYYGETQTDLAFSINLESSSTISNYEIGIRGKNAMDNYIKIANHYDIPIGILLDDSYGEIKNFKKTITLKELGNIITKIFPIISSPRALKETQFNNGFNAHKRIYESLRMGKINLQTKDQEISTIFDSYSNSNQSEALVNYLSWTMLLGAGLRVPHSYKIIKDNLKGEELNLVELRHDMIRCSEKIDDETKQFYEDIDNEINSIINYLVSAGYFSLSNYFLALKYLYNITEKQDKYNPLIGNEMMRAFAITGNKYARKFMNIMKTL